ncbi:MAG: hypothetical protein JO314_01470 [Acidobacteria bacterium]|nr:hypothetical protein [Acidobacteriota bacterium]
MKHEFTAFIDDLKSTHGRNLASVILYGSAAAGDHVRQHSKYNVLIALEKIRPSDLRNAQACVREWVRAGNPLPVYFTVRELHDAADVFPIEFHHMMDHRKVLFGPDVLAEVEISAANLRLQTEYELRSKLLQLRRAYIPASASVDGLKRLMAESLGSFAALFSAALIVSGVKPPATKREVVRSIAQQLDLDGLPLEKVLNIREDNFSEKLNERSANELFGQYMEQIENVINAVDEIGK